MLRIHSKQQQAFVGQSDPIIQQAPISQEGSEADERMANRQGAYRKGFVIRKGQMERLDEDAHRKFAKELTPLLAEKYPHVLPSFPPLLQIEIVINMIGRARRLGITWQSAFVAFTELMLAIAPNFDEEPSILAILSRDGIDPNRTLLGINRLVPRDAWTTAEASSQDLPLFTQPELLEAPLRERIVRAIPFALGDLLGGIELNSFTDSSMALSNELGLGDIEDSHLVVAAWQFLYGKNFRNISEHPWVDDIFGVDGISRERVAMLKYRISLDHGRFV